jgi:hypothetical protein
MPASKRPCGPVVALTLVLATACGGSAPTSAARQAPELPTPGSILPTATAPPPSLSSVAVATPVTPGAGSPAPAGAVAAPHDDAPAGLPSSPDLPPGVQTAVAVLEKPEPPPAPDQLDPRALAAAPESQVGKRVVLYGQVARVIDKDRQRWVELLALPPGDTVIQAVDLLLADTAGTVEREACYRVEGVVAGRDELGRAFVGSTRDAPLVLATEIADAPLGPYGIGCAPP